jgi:membrane protease YdiL (CAAX protease family)
MTYEEQILVFKLMFRTSLNFSIFFTTFLGVLQSYLVLNVFEEVIFRGALWVYLRSLGLSERTTFFVQAFLFWIAHPRFLFLGDWYSFWVAAPCIAILLGLLVWRSKSLTPSVLAHFLFNFISQLLLIIY